MGKIYIKGLRIYAYHGMEEHEKENGQTFEMDITLGLDLSEACISDRLDKSTSYARVIQTINKTMLSEKNNLIERAAKRVIDALFEKYERIQSIQILLKKPYAPINEDFDWIAVEISEKRNNA